jgi:hypothetical protein
VRYAVAGLALIACGRFDFDPPNHVGDAAGDAPGSAARIAPRFIQYQDGVQMPASTLSISFGEAVMSGDLIVVTVAFVATPLATLTALTDTTGDTFTVLPVLVATPTTASYVAYAFASSTATETVTTTLSAQATLLAVRVHDYAGVDPAQPVDMYATATGSASGSDAIAVPITTSNPNDLLFAYAISATGAATVGTDFVPLSTVSGDVTEDRLAAQPGTYMATASTLNPPWSIEALALDGM